MAAPMKLQHGSPDINCQSRRFLILAGFPCAQSRNDVSVHAHQVITWGTTDNLVVVGISRVENIVITIIFTKESPNAIPNHDSLFPRHIKLLWHSQLLLFANFNLR